MEKRTLRLTALGKNGAYIRSSADVLSKQETKKGAGYVVMVRIGIGSICRVDVYFS